jgi:hypothetical protein
MRSALEARLVALERRRRVGWPHAPADVRPLAGVSEEELDFLEELLTTPSMTPAEWARISDAELQRRFAEWQESRRAQP